MMIIIIVIIIIISVKFKVHPRIGHACLKVEHTNICVLCFTSAPQGGVGGQNYSGTHCTGGWVGPQGWSGRLGKSLPYRDSIPGPLNP